MLGIFGCVLFNPAVQASDKLIVAPDPEKLVVGSKKRVHRVYENEKTSKRFFCRQALDDGEKKTVTKSRKTKKSQRSRGPLEKQLLMSRDSDDK